MQIIYEPAGRAREYSELAANLYRGCDHGCVYCYAPTATRRSVEAFAKAEPRAGILGKLLKDCEEMREKNDQRNVLLCFTCDPYQAIDARYGCTRQAIQMFNRHDVNYTVLTKGGARSERDLDLLATRPDLSTYAATLVFTDEAQRRQYEPGAAAPTPERIAALEKAHALGIRTWVSCEPVFDPAQTLDLIRQTHEFVDLFKVGKLNYMDEAKSVDWGAFALDAVALLEDLGAAYYLKDDLRKFL